MRVTHHARGVYPRAHQTVGILQQEAGDVFEFVCRMHFLLIFLPLILKTGAKVRLILEISGLMGWGIIFFLFDFCFLFAGSSVRRVLCFLLCHRQQGDTQVLRLIRRV